MVTARTALVGLAVFGLVLLSGWSLRSTMLHASPSPYASVIVPNLSLRQPQSPARLDRSSVLTIIKEKLNPALFTHPFTVQYGADDESVLSLPLAGSTAQAQPLGVRDVWKVTITGLHLSRPCGSARAVPMRCAPPVRTLAIFVDDKAARILESRGF